MTINVTNNGKIINTSTLLSKGMQDELENRKNSCLFPLQKYLNILLKLLHRQFKSRCQNAFFRLNLFNNVFIKAA